MQAAPRSSVKASLAIATDLRERIARGELAPGDPLPVESEFTEQLGVSKGVVREALRILETEGLVEVRRGLGGGPRVRHPSISQAAMPMGVYLQIGDVSVMDVFEARDRIIAHAVQRLASTPPPDGLGPLDEAIRELGTLVGDLDTYYLKLLDVGETAVRLSGNRTEHVLVVALRHVIAAELEAATRAVADDIELAVEVEGEIVQTWIETTRHIRAGRPEAARRRYANQAELIRDGIVRLMGEATVVDVFNEA